MSQLQTARRRPLVLPLENGFRQPPHNELPITPQQINPKWFRIVVLIRAENLPRVQNTFGIEARFYALHDFDFIGRARHREISFLLHANAVLGTDRATP